MDAVSVAGWAAGAIAVGAVAFSGYLVKLILDLKGERAARALTADEEARTWRPDHVASRVREVFAGIEGARAAADACHVHGLVTEACEERDVAPKLFKAGAMVAEPRRLDQVAIVCTNDQPGSAHDVLWVTVRGLELRCDEDFQELWKLVRAPDGAWLVDHITTGDAVPTAVRALGGDTGAVGRA